MEQGTGTVRINRVHARNLGHVHKVQASIYIGGKLLIQKIHDNAPRRSGLDILRTELTVAMQQVGAPSLGDLKPAMVVKA